MLFSGSAIHQKSALYPKEKTAITNAKIIITTNNTASGRDSN